MKKISFLLVFVLLACASVKNTENNESSTIEYQVSIHRVFPDSIWPKVKNQEPGVALQSQLQNLKSKENPNPAFYTLTLNDSVSKLSYLEPVEIDRNTRLVRHVAPFTKFDSYKFLDSSAVYIDMSEKLPKICMKKENLEFVWADGKKDSIISGMDVHLMIGKNENAEIKAWTTQKFPKALSSYDIYCNSGFVLAYELFEYNQPPFKVKTRKVYPTKIKSTNKKLTAPNLESKKMMSKQEILNYFRKMKNKQK